jgi:APA family basic amino acid/polyamine antiporter
MFREPERFSGRRLAVDATVAILAFAYSFWMIYGAGQEYIAQGFLLLMAGIPVYVFLKWRQSRTVPVEAAPGSPVTSENGSAVRHAIVTGR